MLSCSRAYPIEVDVAFNQVLPVPLPDLFGHWFGPIPPVRSTDETAPWGAPGQQRRVNLAGPGHMTETLREVDSPRAFSYRLSGISGPLAAIASHVDGRWEFKPFGTGTRITWTWEVSLRAVGRLVAPVFAWCWRGYARAALAELEHLLVQE